MIMVLHTFYIFSGTKLEMPVNTDTTESLSFPSSLQNEPQIHSLAKSLSVSHFI